MADRQQDRRRESSRRSSSNDRGGGESWQQTLGIHADQDMQKFASRVERLSDKGEIDLSDLTDLAAEFGDKAGLSEGQKKLLKAFGDDLNKDDVAKIPGVVVDKETGSISVLGLLNLDPTDPMSKSIAKGIAAGYSVLALNANEFGYKKLYEGASKLATRFDLLKASNGRIGNATAAHAAATALVAGISFWPDLVNFVQLEKQGRKDVMSMATKFAPIIDDYQKSGSRVAQLYQITSDDNEMIYNERRRMGMQHNANRFRQGVEVMGRVPLFAASLIRGRALVSGAAEAAKLGAEASKTPQAGETPQELRDRLIRERKNYFINEGATPYEALKFAREDVDGRHLQNHKPQELEAAKGLMGKLSHDAVSGGVLLAPVVADMVSRNLFNQRLKDKGVQPISACDMVFELRQQINDNPKADRYALPKGMSIEGSKTGNNQLRLEEYIEQIFKQHERDCPDSDGKIPARYDEALHDASKLIANALREGRIDGIALVKLVGERKIVRKSGKTVAPEEIVNQELDRLEDQMRNVAYVDNKRYFEESSFTPEELKATWDGMDAQERAAFVQWVPSQALEYAGVDGAEIRAIREQRAEHFYDDLAQMTHSLLALDESVLKELNVTKAELRLLKQADQLAQSEGAGEIGKKMKREINQIDHAVANTIVRAKGTEHEGVVQTALKTRLAANENNRAANDNSHIDSHVDRLESEAASVEATR